MRKLIKGLLRTLSGHWHQVILSVGLTPSAMSFFNDFWFGGRILHMFCLLGPLWSVYKGCFKIPLFSTSSVFLMVLNPPSGVENSIVKNMNWLNVSKTCNILCFLQYCQFLPLFETLSQILLREGNKWSSYLQCTCQDATFDVWQGGILHISIFNSRRWIEDHQEDRTGGKQWNFEKSFIYTS